ncbi:MAG: TolC family protein [Candidatus Gastranaerophilaceae bacterium]
MKFKKIITLICVLSLTIGTAYAIQDNKKPQQNITYTNEVHSVFSLEDCTNVAIENNPDIRASIYNEQAYKSRIGQAWANYFPTISLGVEVSRTGNKYSHAKNLPYGYETMYTTMGYIPTISADMLLFDFGKTKANADMAKNMYLASKEDTKENINTIIYSIKSAYFNILFAQAQIKVYEDTVKDYQLQLNQAWSFYKLGKKAKLDVVTADYNLGKAKLNLVKAKNILEVAQAELSRIMGFPEYTNYELSDDLNLNTFDITSENAIKMAMDVRPELISAEKMANAAKMNLRAIRREFTPNLGAFGSYTYGYGNNYNLSSAQIGVGLNYNALNIMRLKKQINEAKAEYEKNLAQYDSIKDSVYFNVKKAYLNLQTDKETIIIAKLALDQAKEQYRQVTGRYKAGVGDAIELKDGENTYLNARLDFYNAILNYNLAFANLEKEIGVPIKFSENMIIKISPSEL